jgi:hypothetical protein
MTKHPRPQMPKGIRPITQQNGFVVNSPLPPSPPPSPSPLQSPLPFMKSEDSEIHYIANHLNDNLKMLLYLVDADKLKKVQNILFGKNKHSRSTKHSAYHQLHKTKKYQRAAQYTTMPMKPSPFANLFGDTSMPVIKYNNNPQIKHTKKHKINNQNNNSEPDSQ